MQQILADNVITENALTVVAVGLFDGKRVVFYFSRRMLLKLSSVSWRLSLCLIGGDVLDGGGSTAAGSCIVQRQ